MSVSPGLSKATKFVALVLSGLWPLTPLGLQIFENHVLASVLPIPLGIWFLKLLLASASVAVCVFLLDLTAPDRSGLEKVFNGLGALLAGLGAGGLLIIGSFSWGSAIEPDSAHGIVQPSQHFEAVQLQIAMAGKVLWWIGLAFCAVAIASWAGSLTACARAKSVLTKIRFWAIETPLLLTSFLLAWAANPRRHPGDHHFVDAISARIGLASRGSLLGLPADIPVRTVLSEAAGEAFFLGIAFGALAVQLIVTKVANAAVLLLASHDPEASKREHDHASK